MIMTCERPVILLVAQPPTKRVRVMEMSNALNVAFTLGSPPDLNGLVGSDDGRVEV
jgi:hypothetical protein